MSARPRRRRTIIEGEENLIKEEKEETSAVTKQESIKVQFLEQVDYKM